MGRLSRIIQMDPMASPATLQEEGRKPESGEEAQGGKQRSQWCPATREHGQPLEAGEDTEMDRPLDPEGHSPADTPILAQ